MSSKAYVPPCFRNQNNSNKYPPMPQPNNGNNKRVTFSSRCNYQPRQRSTYYEEEERDSQEIEQFRRELIKSENTVRALEKENQTLKQQITTLESDLSFYTSKGAKVPEDDFLKLKTEFEHYKTVKYNEFVTIKDKLKTHDETVSNLNKEIRKLEEENRLSRAKVSQYANSVKDLNQRIKELQEVQPIMTAPQPTPNSTPDFIEADWNNIKRALDFILSLDKKEISKAGFNAAELKYTRQLIK